MFGAEIPSMGWAHCGCMHGPIHCLMLWKIPPHRYVTLLTTRNGHWGKYSRKTLIWLLISSLSTWDLCEQWMKFRNCKQIEHLSYFVMQLCRLQPVYNRHWKVSNLMISDRQLSDYFITLKNYNFFHLPVQVWHNFTYNSMPFPKAPLLTWQPQCPAVHRQVRL